MQAHLDTWEKDLPRVVAELRKSLYVDDLVSGGRTVQQAQQNKQESTDILHDVTFQLHKWNSNHRELEDSTSAIPEDETQAYAKQQLDSKAEGSKILGLKWNKQRDTLYVVMPVEGAPPTKRGILGKLARIYDPLGFVAPLTLIGKRIYREVCEAKIPWETQLNNNLLRVWKHWKQQLPVEYEVPRPITPYHEEIEEVELHAFGDASGQGVGVAVYSVVRQRSGTTQQLVAAKSRFAKKGLTIPRLELVGAHMAMNLLVNVRNALDNVPTPQLYGWIDSTVALHWIKGNGQYKQFVANRVAKIQLHQQIQWRHVPSSDNPADLASRGGPVQSSTLWQRGPEWLQTKRSWPENRVTQASLASEKEAKITREILNVAKIEPKSDEFDDLLKRVSLRRALRVGVWIRRFAYNCRSKTKTCGPITADEVRRERTWWIKRIQERDILEAHYAKTKPKLDLRANEDDLDVCHGRIQGKHPVYLPRNAVFTEKMVERMHYDTLHGGVGLTMAAIREEYWVPKLRSLVKVVRRKCNGCMRFRATAFTRPAPGKLPQDRTTTGGVAFEVVGTDFAGPIRYKRSQKKEGKAYLAIFACSLS